MTMSGKYLALQDHCMDDQKRILADELQLVKDHPRFAHGTRTTLMERLTFIWTSTSTCIFEV